MRYRYGIRSLLLVLLLVSFITSVVYAKPRVHMFVWHKSSGKVEWSNPTIEAIVNEYPEILNTRFGVALMLTSLYSPNEEIGIGLNGEFIGDDGQYITHYNTLGEIYITVNALDYAAGNYHVRIVITEPDGNQVERETDLFLGGNVDNDVTKDQIEIYYITKCEVQGIYKIEFYVDEELMLTDKWDYRDD